MPDATNLRQLAQITRTEDPPKMIVWHLPDTARAQSLCVLASFYNLNQHDHMKARWSGAAKDPGVGYLRDRMEPQGFTPTNAAVSAPWTHRRPDCPHGLPKQVTKRFSDMLLGEQGRPTISVPASEDTSAYVNAVMSASKTWATMLTARDTKGARGSAAVVLSVVDGVPTSEPLCPENLRIEWKETADWIPVSVMEQKLIDKQVAVEEDGKTTLEVKKFWRTRYWDEQVEISYQDVPEDWDEEVPDWPIPIDGEPVEHGIGRCPVVWLQNTRCTESPEGECDMDGVHEESDKLDKVRSFAVRATIANTDPTIHHKDTRQMLQRNPMLEKGHGKSIKTSEVGDVKLLETSGSGVEMAWNTSDQLRHDILQTVSCVIMDPDTIGSYKSGEALSILWQSMEQRCNRYRVPIEDEIRQAAEIWIALGREMDVVSIEDVDRKRDDKDKKPKSGIILPPREVFEDDADEDAEPKLQPHTVGEGQWVKLVWGPYQRPTATQLQAMITALTTANGQKAVLSQETTTELVVGALSLGDPQDEVNKIKAEKETAMEEFGLNDMGGDDPFGGKDDDDDAKAEGAAAKNEAVKNANSTKTDDSQGTAKDTGE